MKSKIAVIPAIAYSISNLLNSWLRAVALAFAAAHVPERSEAFGRLGETPHQNEEHNHDCNVEKIQHGSPQILYVCTSITSCPAFNSAWASFSSRVRHHRFLVARMTIDGGSSTRRNPSSQSR